MSAATYTTIVKSKISFMIFFIKSVDTGDIISLYENTHVDDHRIASPCSRVQP
jgi:hypothetical protein